MVMEDLRPAFPDPVNRLASCRTAPALIHDILHAGFGDLRLHYTHLRRVVLAKHFPFSENIDPREPK